MNAITVLIADDHPLACERLRTMLEAATQRLKVEHPHVAVIIMTGSEDDALGGDMPHADAADYTPKGGMRQLVTTGIGMEAPEGPLNDAATWRRARGVSLDGSARTLRSQDVGLLEPLTEREKLVLQFMANGQTNKEIGDALGYAEVTVKKCVQIIFDKLHVSDRTHAAITAMRLRLIA